MQVNFQVLYQRRLFLSQGVCPVFVVLRFGCSVLNKDYDTIQSSTLLSLLWSCSKTDVGGTLTMFCILSCANNHRNPVLKAYVWEWENSQRNLSLPPQEMLFWIVVVLNVYPLYISLLTLNCSLGGLLTKPPHAPFSSVRWLGHYTSKLAQGSSIDWCSDS